MGKKFQSVGMSEAAVASYFRGGFIKEAIDCCIHLNKVKKKKILFYLIYFQWDVGIQLAENQQVAQLENLISRVKKQIFEIFCEPKISLRVIYWKKIKHFMLSIYIENPGTMMKLRNYFSK